MPSSYYDSSRKRLHHLLRPSRQTRILQSLTEMRTTGRLFRILQHALLPSRRALTARAHSKSRRSQKARQPKDRPAVLILLSTTVTSTMCELVAMCSHVPDFIRRLFIHVCQVSSVLCFPLQSLRSCLQRFYGEVYIYGVSTSHSFVLQNIAFGDVTMLGSIPLNIVLSYVRYDFTLYSTVFGDVINTIPKRVVLSHIEQRERMYGSNLLCLQQRLLYTFTDMLCMGKILTTLAIIDNQCSIVTRVEYGFLKKKKK